MSKSNSQGAANSFANGPGGTTALKTQRDSGFSIKPASHWDYTEGRLPE